MSPFRDYNRCVPHREINLHTTPGLWPPTWPMGMTMLRLLLLPLFIWTILIDHHPGSHPHRWAAVAIFAVMAITDKLDGYLARRLNQTSRLGAVLDPLADKLLVACSVILLSFDYLAAPGFDIPWWVVLAVYGKDIVIAVGVMLILAVVGKIDIIPRPLGKASTAIQLAMVIAVLLAPEHPGDWERGWLVLVTVLWWAVSVVAVLAMGDYVVRGVMQYAAGRRVTAQV